MNGKSDRRFDKSDFLLRIFFFSVKDAFDKIVVEGNKPNERYGEKKHLTGYDEMWAHLFRVEMCTKSYLKTLRTTLNDVFKRDFVHDSKKL